ncbi:hypothetical protein B0H17DRAFT_1063929 [Mycena rosella]|uniref:Uncharacterized protein n=1 Tax=Mycena rosella TaxID=1033263 RepID=A0AAD7DGD4_MYCRO|nr:hypothetical protein B0H17DRAFT_1063929 [Mycena rosella]
MARANPTPSGCPLKRRLKWRHTLRLQKHPRIRGPFCACSSWRPACSPCANRSGATRMRSARSGLL